MTIEQFCNKLEIFLHNNLAEKNEIDPEDLFFKYEADSDAYWIKLGFPQKWFDEEEVKV